MVVVGFGWEMGRLDKIQDNSTGSKQVFIWGKEPLLYISYPF